MSMSITTVVVGAVGAAGTTAVAATVRAAGAHILASAIIVPVLAHQITD